MWFWFAPFILIAPEPLPDGLLPVRNEMPEIRSGGDLTQEALVSERGGKLRAQHLDRDLARVFEVVREIDRCHAARAEFALETVPIG